MPDQIQLSLEELYKIIGEKEVLRHKLTEENQRLRELVETLSKDKEEKKQWP